MSVQVLTCLAYQIVAALALIIRNHLAQLLSASDDWIDEGHTGWTASRPKQDSCHPTCRLSPGPADSAPSLVRWWHPSPLLPPKLPQHRDKLTVSRILVL